VALYDNLAFAFAFWLHDQKMSN